VKKVLSLVALGFILLVPGLLAQTQPSQAATPSTASELIQAGDALYAEFDDSGALAKYEAAAKLDPKSYEALWKTARAYLDVADRIKPETKEKKAEQEHLYLTSEEYAKKAIQVNANDTWGHFFYSAAMGMHALQLGKKEQISMSKKIKAEIEKAIELDPRNDLAWHALGRWQRRMAEIGGVSRFFGGIIFGSIPKGSFDEAVKDFQKAIEIRPDYCNHHLELGRTYLDMKKKDLAAKEFQIALDDPVLTSKCADYKEEAREELDKLKKK
jgi:tetratricopeptide (TPR) repeat protein